MHAITWFLIISRNTFLFKEGGNCFKLEKDGREELIADVTIRKGNTKRRKSPLKRNW